MRMSPEGDVFSMRLFEYGADLIDDEPIARGDIRLSEIMDVKGPEERAFELEWAEGGEGEGECSVDLELEFIWVDLETGKPLS